MNKFLEMFNLSRLNEKKKTENMKRKASVMKLNQ